MQLADVPVLSLGFHGDARAAIERTLAHGPLRRLVDALGDHHVAPVAAAPVQVASAGGAFFHGCHHLEEVASDWHQRVLEAPLSDTGIDEAGLDAEDVGEIVYGRREFPRD